MERGRRKVERGKEESVTIIVYIHVLLLVIVHNYIIDKYISLLFSDLHAILHV